MVTDFIFNGVTLEISHFRKLTFSVHFIEAFMMIRYLF